jgi:predicted  nucleic acid-binding Zn-ribbon protein
MGQRIDQFCETLRAKLTNIDNGLGALKTKIDGKAQGAEQDVRAHLERLHKRVEHDRSKVSAARTEMRDWVEDRKAATADKIAEWKAKRETSKLQNRADRAERYATAALEVALAAVDEAEHAALEAWLARQDATSGSAQKA